MRPLCFALPALDLRAGGHTAQMRFADAAGQIRPVTVATYRQRTPQVPLLDDLLRSGDRDAFIYVVHWGPHVPALLRRLAGRDVVYFAHSTGYRFELPPEVPIVAVSRHTMAHWGRRAHGGPLYHLPNVLPDGFRPGDGPRDIDVLVLRRKSSSYLLRDLVPALETQCHLVVVDRWVEDLAAWFRRSKVYLYDSTEFWMSRGVTEGHGLPPLEALACGCTVFSSLNDGLADYLDPGFNCQQLRVYAGAHDLARVLAAVREWCDDEATRSRIEATLAPYQRRSVLARMEQILPAIERFFEARASCRPDIEAVRLAARRARLRRWLGSFTPTPVRHWWGRRGREGR